MVLDTDIPTRDQVDDLYADRLREFAETFERRASQGRVVHDLADLARFSTRGAVATACVDLDARVTGSIDDATGAVSFAEGDAGTHDLVDEVARRVHQTGGRLLVVRSDDVPGGGPMARSRSPRLDRQRQGVPDPVSRSRPKPGIDQRIGRRQKP